jgi:hypothetical protein
VAASPVAELCESNRWMSSPREHPLHRTKDRHATLLHSASTPHLMKETKCGAAAEMSGAVVLATGADAATFIPDESSKGTLAQKYNGARVAFCDGTRRFTVTENPLPTRYLASN